MGTGILIIQKGGIHMVNLKKVTLRKEGDVRIAKPKVSLAKHSGTKVDLTKKAK